MNVGLRIIELEEEHLGDDQVGTAVVDHALQKDDPVFQEPAVDVENALFAAASFDHVGNQGHGKFLRANPAAETQSAAGNRGDKGNRKKDVSNKNFGFSGGSRNRAVPRTAAKLPPVNVFPSFPPR